MKSSGRNTQSAEMVVRDPRWVAVVTRASAADGTFFYSVRTTGVYCRPACAARLPRPENVAFHATREDAERAGFRACLRCKPDEPLLAEVHAARITAACRFIEAAETAPSLAVLAKLAGLSKYHFHRVFKAIAGVTPKAYANAHRAQRVRAQLTGGGSITGAMYGAGYNSSGRFYAQSHGVLGMTPSRFRAGGANSVIRFAVGECSLGAILVAASERGVCSILLGDDPDALLREVQDQFAHATLIGGDDVFEQLVARVIGLIEAPQVGIELPMDLRGTAFQQRVWQALREIPAGTTQSYSHIAAKLGAPKSARAVAQACACNTLAVAIPCHRVVRQDGALSGYRWGVERKRALLEREAAPAIAAGPRRRVNP